jgi:hypothetical protein
MKQLSHTLRSPERQWILHPSDGRRWPMNTESLQRRHIRRRTGIDGRGSTSRQDASTELRPNDRIEEANQAMPGARSSGLSTGRPRRFAPGTGMCRSVAVDPQLRERGCFPSGGCVGGRPQRQFVGELGGGKAAVGTPRGRTAVPAGNEGDRAGLVCREGGHRLRSRGRTATRC